MNVDPVIARLQEWIGLKPDAIGPNVLATTVRTRMQSLGVTEPFAYLAQLTSNPAEREALLADVVVPETWFFRGGTLFNHLAVCVRDAAAAQPGQPARVLCVPCSTGEEPYSLAMALQEAGQPAGTWTLTGVDLCRRSLEGARRGRYRELSFRQTDPVLRSRYFRSIEDEWELYESTRDTVTFLQGNLVEPGFLGEEKPFCLILCRNLFIYLHPAARQQALANLDRLLLPGGHLCMGPAEPLDANDTRFQRAGPDGSFLYRRVPPQETGTSSQQARGLPVTRPRPVSTLTPRTTLVANRSQGSEPPPINERPAHRSPVSESKLPAPGGAPARLDDPLALARRHADAGRLDEALAACRDQLNRGGPSPALYTLLGILYQARQESDEAARCFHKALYLQPDHAEAVLHLMILSERQGDQSQADRLRHRLERLSTGGNS